MNTVEQLLLAENISDIIIEKLSKTSSIALGEGDFTIADIQKILGIGASAAYKATYHGEYRHNGRRLVRREVFLYRRKQGLDVCIRK